MIPKPTRRNRWTHTHYQRVFEGCVYRGFVNRRGGIHGTRLQVREIGIRMKEVMSRVGRYSPD